MATKKNTITHTWTVERLVQLNDGSGAVTSLDYKVRSTDGTNSCDAYGSIQLETENIENFVPYESLSEEIVIGWVKEKLGESLGGHEVNNAAWIDAVANPPAPTTISTELPW